MGLFTVFTVKATTATKDKVSVRKLIASVLEQYDPCNNWESHKINSIVNGAITTHAAGYSVNTDSKYALCMLSDIASVLEKNVLNFAIEVDRLAIFGGNYSKYKRHN